MKIGHGMPFFPIAVLLYVAVKQKPTALTICIDPGHPSEVGRGTQGRKLTEIHVNWVIAKAVEKILIGKGVHVVLTKKSRRTSSSKTSTEPKSPIGRTLTWMLRLHCDKHQRY